MESALRFVWAQLALSELLRSAQVCRLWRDGVNREFSRMKGTFLPYSPPPLSAPPTLFCGLCLAFLRSVGSVGLLRAQGCEHCIGFG